MGYYFKLWGPTPSKGDYLDVYFLDENLQPTREPFAPWCRIHEYTADGVMLMSTMGICDPNVGEENVKEHLPKPVFADRHIREENDRKWAENIKSYLDHLDAGCCPECGSKRIQEARFLDPQQSFTLACYDCKATVHYEGKKETIQSEPK